MLLQISPSSTMDILPNGTVRKETGQFDLSLIDNFQNLASVTVKLHHDSPQIDDTHLLQSICNIAQPDQKYPIDITLTEFGQSQFPTLRLLKQISIEVVYEQNSLRFHIDLLDPNNIHPSIRVSTNAIPKPETTVLLDEALPAKSVSAPIRTIERFAPAQLPVTIYCRQVKQATPDTLTPPLSPTSRVIPPYSSAKQATSATGSSSAVSEMAPTKATPPSKTNPASVVGSLTPPTVKGTPVQDASSTSSKQDQDFASRLKTWQQHWKNLAQTPDSSKLNLSTIFEGNPAWRHDPKTSSWQHATLGIKLSLAPKEQQVTAEFNDNTSSADAGREAAKAWLYRYGFDAKATFPSITGPKAFVQAAREEIHRLTSSQTPAGSILMTQSPHLDDRSKPQAHKTPVTTPATPEAPNLFKGHPSAHTPRLVSVK